MSGKIRTQINALGVSAGGEDVHLTPVLACSRLFGASLWAAGFRGSPSRACSLVFARIPHLAWGK